MRIPDSVIEEVSRRVDIVDVVANYVTLKKSGSRYMGLCPFHTEKTPSFSVNPEMGAYYCFGCHRGGTVFTFLMEVEGLTFPEAVKQLADKVGVELTTEEDDDRGKKRRALLELYERVAGSFSYMLLEHEEGADALLKLGARGLSRKTIEDFGLGYAPSDAYWLQGFLVKKGYSEAFLRDSGLFTRANQRRALFAGRIIFPIRSRRGEIIAFGGRVVQGDGPKYINSPETELFQKRSTLYGLDRAVQIVRKEGRVVIAEGYMDVLALHQAGVAGAVAPLGTALTDEHSRMLSRLCDVALLVFDADTAGIAATKRAAETLERSGIRSEVAPMEAGADPADLLERKGSQAVVEAISSPLSALEFLIRAQMDQMPGSTPESKEFVLREVFPYISMMNSEVRRRENLRLTADLIGADREAVLRDYGRFHRQPRTVRGEREESRGSTEPSAHATAIQVTHDLILMLATVSSREHFAYVRRWVEPEHLDSDAAREVFVALEEAYRRDEDSLELLLQRISDPVLVELTRRRVASGEFDGDQEQAVRDGVLAIRRRAVQRRIREVEAKLRRVGAGSGTPEDESELLGEKMYLDKELQKLKGESG